MKDNFTIADLKPNVYTIGLVIIISAAFLLLSACSSGMEQNGSNQIGITGDKSFSFKDAGSEWKVNFQDNEIESLYKNGVRIPDEEIDNHKDMIYKNLGELYKDYGHLSDKVHKFNFDMDKFGKDMEKFKEEFDKDKFLHFKLEFDEDELEQNLEKMEEHLNKLKDKKIDLYFDSEAFNDKMKDLEEELKNMPKLPEPGDFDVDIFLDMDKFKDGMKHFRDSFKHFDIKIDSSVIDLNEIKDHMLEVKKNLKGLKVEIHDVKSGVKNLNEFLDDLKSEMISDGYLTSTDDNYDLEMSSEITKVNDQTVKPEHHKKYSDIYLKHFHKKLDGTIKIKKD